MANFRTKARAIDLLGRNQIADLPTAITELWKNGYDAYGDYLDAGLYRAGYKDVKYDIFTICYAKRLWRFKRRLGISGW